MNQSHSSSEDHGSSMNASLKNALMKMMQNKEQEQASKLQFREDLDHMDEKLKFAVSSLD